MSEAVAIIHERGQKAILRQHPWVFSGAIASVEGEPADGDIIALRTRRGDFLARGYWNSRSAIRVHLLSWNEDEAIDEGFWRKRLQRAIDARQFENDRSRLGTPDAYRLVNAENDWLPGLVVDR